jgi:hypothetical protein
MNVYTKNEVDELVQSANAELSNHLLTVEGALGFAEPTAAPSSPGTFIKNIYFNTNLSHEEVVSVLRSIVPNRYDERIVFITANH